MISLDSEYLGTVCLISLRSQARLVTCTIRFIREAPFPVSWIRLEIITGTSIDSDTVTVVSPTGASNLTSYIAFLRQRGEASTGGFLGTSMASNGLNLAELRGLVY